MFRFRHALFARDAIQKDETTRAICCKLVSAGDRAVRSCYERRKITGFRVTMTETARARKPDGGFADQDEIMLGVLSAIDRDSHTSQRSISRELGVALGLANAYLKRCVSKGFIKIQQVPHRRYAYYLTPHGFAEKARLTGQYLSASFTFFRRARVQMSELLAKCEGCGYQRIAFAGISELAEVGVLSVSDHQFELVGIIEPGSAGSVYLGLDVKAAPGDFGTLDAIIVTDLKAPDATYRTYAELLGADRVFAPHILGINRSRESVDKASLGRAAG
jgi:DNA-binding MarR family transcriptional regulator